METWKEITGYEGRYMVSNKGRIQNIRTGKILKQSYCKDRYLAIHLSKDGHEKSYSVHRLVAKAFIENPDNKPEINHKDRNKENNCMENLEWVTGEENRLHASNGDERVRDKKVAKIDKNGNVLNVFNGIRDAARNCNLCRGDIRKVCQGRRKSTGGFLWSFIDNIGV